MAYYGFNHLDSINASIRRLYCALGNAHITQFDRSMDNNIDFQVVFKRDSISQVQHFARCIAQHYRLSVGNISIQFNENLAHETPGHVELSSTSDFNVELSWQTLRNSNDLFAVLAHEITHIYLYRIGLSFADTMQDEILTDTVATYLGLGNLILNAYADTELSTKWFGYLTPVEFGYIIAKRAKKFKEDPAPFLQRDAREAFYTGLAVLEDEYRLLPLLKGSTRIARLRYLWRRRLVANKSMSEKSFTIKHESSGYAFELDNGVSVIFQCLSCSQRLRIPAFRRLLTLRCPTCGYLYECAS